MKACNPDIILTLLLLLVPHSDSDMHSFIEFVELISLSLVPILGYLLSAGLAHHL